MKTSFTPSFDEEKFLWDNGYDYVLGIDEVGRGAFAGPVVAAAVVFSKNHVVNSLHKINDSKLLKPSMRTSLDRVIRQTCLHFGIGEVSTEIINTEGIGKATFLAIQKAILQALAGIEKTAKKFLLVDGFRIPHIKNIEQKGIVKGDQKCLSIAAASIIAKVYRDKLMQNFHIQYPHYDFFTNKGYGTAFHRKALQQHGLSKLHRTSFNLKKFL